jgi:hypothetical protein
MMKSVYTIIGYYLLGMLLLGACSDEENVSSSALHKEGEIVLSSTRAHVITRSGDLVENFKVGTLYRLYAFLSSDSQTYDWTSTTYLNGSLGRETETEDGDREIVYGLDINKEEGIARNYPKNGSLDLYGVTFGSEVDPQSVNVQQEGKRPVWHIAFPSVKDAEIDGTEEMPDLMFSNNKRGASVADGKVSMRFKHALSLLKFNVVWEEQAEGSKAKYDLEKVQVRKIEVLDLHKEGDFDMVSGAWSYAENSKYSRTYYENQEGLSKPEKSYSYTFNDSIRIFPNQKDEAIKIRVTLYDGNTDKECEVVREYPLTNNGSDLVLESNYVYQITIMLLTNDVRIMVLLPTVYEWNDVELAEEDVYLGQPVTFGGLMWMDRNLGAKTADAKNDFYNSIGYYYQFGRNIPYMLDVEKWVYYAYDDDDRDLAPGSGYAIMTDTSTEGSFSTGETYKNSASQSTFYSSYLALGSTKNLSEGEKNKLREYQVKCIYTFDHKGDSVFGYRFMSGQDGDDLSFRNPGEVYMGADGNVDDEKTRELYRFAGIRNEKGSNPYYQDVWTASSDLASFWMNPDDQPCPKGWRLPTRSDLYTFMPTTTGKVSWSSSWSSSAEPKVDTDEKGNIEEYLYGSKKNADGKSYSVLYMIKNKGTSEAYRIRIITDFSKGYKNPEMVSTNKRYIMVSRYTCDKDKGIEDYVADGKDETEWNNSVESVMFPCAGFIVTDPVLNMRGFGKGSVLRTSESNASSYSWVQYMTLTNFELSVASNSRKALGDQIRCVRDVTAK